MGGVDDGTGDETGCPSNAGHLPTSVVTLHTSARPRARVTLMPEVAGSPLPTVCSSWHKQTGLFVTTLPSDVQHSTVGGVVSFAITYAKQDCSRANSLEQSTDPPAGPGADPGAETGTGTGTGA